MLIDCQIKPSRLRLGCVLAANLVMVVLLAYSGLPLRVKIALCVAASIFNLADAYRVYRGWIKQSAQHIWQLNRCEWYVQSVHNVQALPAELLSVDFRGFAVCLTLTIKQRPQRLVIWKDQVNQTEWRKLKVLSRMHQPSSHRVF
jgi:hypothetical protein